MECSCEVNGLGCNDEYEECEEKILIHQTPSVIIKCGECERRIEIGEEYEWYRGEHDGDRYTHHTCMDCLSLRFYFFGDWTFETLWESFKDHMDECDWQVPESCLSKVTPAARAEICEYIEKAWEGADQ